MRKKRVVFYGRVSTTSEEQLSALENQMQWYQDLVEAHPEWEVVGVYEDEGITGTSYRKRKDFKQMMEDGIEHHKFDLIVTSEKYSRYIILDKKIGRSRNWSLFSI